MDKVFGMTDKEAAINAATNALFAAVGGRTNAKQLHGKTVRIAGENGTAVNLLWNEIPS